MSVNLRDHFEYRLILEVELGFGGDCEESTSKKRDVWCISGVWLLASEKTSRRGY